MLDDGFSSFTLYIYVSFSLGFLLQGQPFHDESIDVFDREWG